MKRLLGRACLTLSTGMLAVAAHALPTGLPSQVIHRNIDESQRVALRGNTRPEATAANDRGALAGDTRLSHLILQLKRSDARELALKVYIDGLSNPRSPDYHQWLTPAQFAQFFGVAQADVDIVTAWLAAKGFTVNGVSPTGLQIDFSGTAAQVKQAFGTELHHLSVKGALHFANVSDPQIPEALQSVVAGVVSLHDFRPKPHKVARGPSAKNAKYTYSNSNGTFHELAAGDLATIYNLTPLFNAGYSGRGQSIMVVEDTYLYSTTDWTTFRKTFGLARSYPYGTLSQVSPAGAIACANPGFQGSQADPGYGDDGEAAIDVEWATAAAPNAAIVLAACTDTDTVFGGLIALQNTLNGPVANLPSVVSISYGESEAENGATANASYYATYEQAVAEGVSIFVSSGDELAASQDLGNPATHGISVSGFATTPYNVAVGGTDFGYTALNVDPSTYWNATNTASYSSAKSYIQEIPWNDSCAGGLLAAYIGTTPLGLCNNAQVTSSSGSLNFLLNASGGSGGPSGCATGSPGTAGVVSGTCAGYPKPSWQSGIVGNPGDGVRDIPDVSLFASNGIWDAYYAVCWSNPDTQAGGGYSCTGVPSTWAGFGGTSVSAPIMAAIQALINQKTGSRWGNPNPIYYQIANAEYGSLGSSACNSSTVNKSSNSCKFYDVTQGDIVGVCAGTRSGALRNCYRPGGAGTYGVLSPSGTSADTAYPTSTGWDFATGIGSVNAYNLVMAFPVAD